MVQLDRVPTLPGKPGTVLDFFLTIPGPGKSWKITFVLESPGKKSLKVMRQAPGTELLLQSLHVYRDHM